MQDKSVSMSKFAAGAAWGLMVVAFTVSIGVMIAGHLELAVIIGIKSVLWAAVAGVLTVRCWTLRVCTLLKAAMTVQVERESLRPLR